MKIYLGADHAGFEVKGKLVPFLKDAGYEVVDLGPFTFEALDDYPDYIRPVAEAVASEMGSRGIIIGGSGQGEAMCANRVPGARAAVYYGGAVDIVVLSREHNDANILSLGARFIEESEAQDVVKLWLDTPFSEDERHLRRINKIDNK